MEINLREVYRYMGLKGTEPDAAMAALAAEIIAELQREVTPRSIVRAYPLAVEADDIDFGVLKTKSRSLAKNLRGCREGIFFAATLGSAPDRLIRKYESLSISRALAVQAASAEMIEAYCNEECGKIAEAYKEKGLFLRPRFSPGYGDFPLTCQKPLLEALEAAKRIGITLTDSLLMMPSKSVSAVMGLSTVPYACDVRGCETCAKRDCEFRR